MADTPREIILDLGECTGCTGCHEMCPEHFGWDEATERPYVKTPLSTEDEIRDALTCCPGCCISLDD